MSHPIRHLLHHGAAAVSGGAPASHTSGLASVTAAAIILGWISLAFVRSRRRRGVGRTGGRLERGLLVLWGVALAVAFLPRSVGVHQVGTDLLVIAAMTSLAFVVARRPRLFLAAAGVVLVSNILAAHRTHRWRGL